MLQTDDYIVRGRKGHKTVLKMLEESCIQYKKQVAMRIKVDGEYKEYTYGTLGENINLIAKGLRKKFFLPGERAGVYSENRPEWGMAYFGISKAAGIVIPVDAQLKGSEMEYIINHSRMKFIFTSKKYLDNVKEIFSSVRTLKKIICFDEVKEDKNVIPFSKLIKMGKNYYFPLLHRIKPSDLIAILYTSGTTGIAKAVMLTQNNVISDIELTSQMIYFDEKDTFLSVLPIHHAFECTAGFMLPLYNGASITYAESLKSRNILDNIKETKVTVILGVPLLFEKLYAGILKSVSEKSLVIRVFVKTSMGVVKTVRTLMKKKIGRKVFKGLRTKAGLSSVRFFISGGGPLRPDVAEGFDNLGLTILQGYGLTETSPIVSVSTEEHMNYYSIGLPAPGIEVKIDNPNDRGVGEVIIKGPIVMKGYYKNKEATRDVLKKGCFYTGDLGYFDKIGFLYITGRKKNVIVTQGGKNVFPEEVEAILNMSHFILESMVYGLPVSEKDKGERVSAIIVPDYEAIENHGRHIGVHYNTEEKIEHLINDEVKKVNIKLPVYKRIYEFKIYQEELIKTSTKKIKRYLYLEKLIIVNGKKKNKR